MNAAFGWQIRAARTALGMSLDDVAQATGLHRNSVHRVETIPGRTGGHAVSLISDAFLERGVLFSELDGRSAVSMPNPGRGVRPARWQFCGAAKAQE